VKKVWDDNNNSDGTRPDRVMVQLYANGVAAGDPVELNADTNWQYKWTELKAESQGQEITYTVKEISEFSNYTASYSDDTFTITNTKKDGGGGGNPSNNNSSGKSSNNAANLLAGPMTGDNANLVLPISAGLLAIIGLVVLLRIRKKDSNR
jgi:LPXTG-motif cell wall-anchored protein